MELIRGHRFVILFSLTILYLLVYPFLTTGQFGQVVMDLWLTMILAASFLAMAAEEQRRWWLIALWGIGFIGIWIGKVATAGSLLSAGPFASLAFLFVTVISILRFVFAQRQVTTETIFAALCAYLLGGFCYALVFFGMAIVDPAALSFRTEPANTAAFMWECIYFSFVTLTTLGYGDVTPVAKAARSFAVVEALSGQLYLAVLVARLVGLHISDQSRA